MATPGTKPIPNEIKQRNGTYRADRHGTGGLVTLPQPAGIPEPPASLGTLGRDTWQRVFTNATWIHTETDRIAVELLCSNLDERETLLAIVKADSDNWRARAGLRELEKQINSQLATLGLNPSDRARYGFAVVKTESKLDMLFAMRAENERRFKRNSSN